MIAEDLVSKRNAKAHVWQYFLFEKPVDFCRLSKVILEVSYLIGSPVFADFQFCIGLPRLFNLCVSYLLFYIRHSL